jgi:uncharacterized protein YqeY
MSLGERLLEDQTDATRARDRFRLSVIRMLRAELQNAVIAKRAPLDHEEELAVLSREVKRRQEALADYERAGRPELLESLQREISLLKGYLPPQLTEEELAEIVRQAIAEAGATSKKEIGRVMGLLMPRVKGRVDGTYTRQVVEKILE